jgi:UDP-glucose 4-epimerase
MNEIGSQQQVKMSNVLITGGLGYIGSHIALELISMKHNPIILDNLKNNREKIIERIETIGNSKVKCYDVDLKDQVELSKIFKENNIEIVIHLAGIRDSEQSKAIPLHYYENNIMMTINLLKAMESANCRNIIFSSSSTIYDSCDSANISEDFTKKPINPYGRSKEFIENMLLDLHSSNHSWNILIARHSYPLGAHDQGFIGQLLDPSESLFYMKQVINGEKPYFPIPCSKNGDECRRDYIHIIDLVRGYTSLVDHVDKKPGYKIFNFGTGGASTISEILQQLEQISGKTITSKKVCILSSVTVHSLDCSRAKSELNWEPKHDLKSMCKDLYKWL